MNGESLQRPDPVRLVLADSDTQRIVIPGSPDLSVPDKIDPKEDNDIVAVTINLNHLSHCERMNLFKVIEPYDDNMTVVKKQDLKDNVSLNSLERGLRGPGDMLKNTHSRMQQSVEAPMIKVDGLRGQLNTERGLKSEMNGHTLNEKLYNGNMDTPGTSGGAKFTMPTFGMSGPVIKGADLDGSLSSPQVNLSTPNLSTQYASLDLTDPEVNTGESMYKPSKFKMPQFDKKAPNTDANVSADFKGPGLRGELETPNLNLSASDMDMNVNDIKMNVPNADLKKPKFGLPGGKMKGSNLNLSSPDINLTTPNIDGAINAPNVDMSLPNLEGALQSPELNVEAPSGKFKWPHQKKPKLTGSLNGPNVKANLKTPAVGLSGPNIEGDITPDVNLPKADISGPKVDVKLPGKAKLPKFKKPKFGQSVPKVKTPDIDVNTNLKASTLSLSVPQVDAEINKPTLDAESPSGKFKWLNNLKKPKVTGPDDLNLSTPNINGQIRAPAAKVSLPTADLKGPDVDIQAPEVDMKAPSLKSKFSTLKMPKVNWSGNKVKAPDLNVDANMKTPNVDLSPPEVDLNLPGADLKGPNLNLSSPTVEADIPVPDVDLQTPEVDMKAPSLKSKFTTLKMPKVNWSGNKVKAPDHNVDANMKTPNVDLSPPEVDLNLSGADLKGPNLNLSSPTVEADIPVPDVDLQTPEVDMKVPSLKSKFTTLKMPKVNWPGNKVKAPDLNVDANMKTPNVDLSSPEVDLNLPGADLKGPNINLSSPAFEADIPVSDVDLQTPEVDMKAPSVKSKFSTLKMPKFHWSGNKVKGPDLNIDADMKTPNLSAPGVNVNLPQADFKGSKLKLAAPPVEGDVAVPGVSLPEADLKVSDGKFKLPKTQTAVEVKETDLYNPKIQGSISFPSLSTSTDVKGPNLGADLKGKQLDVTVPDVDLETSVVQMKKMNLFTPNFQGTVDVPGLSTSVPKADINGQNVDAPDVDDNLLSTDFLLELKNTDLNFSAPKIQGTIIAPNLSTSLNKADIKNPDVDLETTKLNLSACNLQGEVNASEIDINVPNPDLKGPKVNLTSPVVEMDAPTKVPVKLPRLDFSSPKLKGSSCEVDAPNKNVLVPSFDNKRVPNIDLNYTPEDKVQGLKSTEVELKPPDVNIETSSEKLHHYKMPSFGLQGSRIKQPNIDASTDVSTPAVADLVPKVDGKYSSPKLNFSSHVSYSGSDIEDSDEDGEEEQSRDETESREVDIPMFKFHRLPQNRIDSALQEAASGRHVMEGTINIMERLKMFKEKKPTANFLPEVKHELSTPTLDVRSTSDADSSTKIRSGTFKVTKPESGLGFEYPVLDTSEGHDRLSISLSNMLGLNIKQTDADYS